MFALLAIALPVSIGVAQSGSDWQSRLKALREEYVQVQNGFFSEYQKLRTEKEQRDFVAKNNPAPRFVDRAMEIARSVGDDPQGWQAYEFAIGICQSAGARDKMVAVAKEAVDKYSKSDFVNGIVGLLSYGVFEKTAAAGMLEKILADNPKDQTKLAATGALARLYKGNGSPSIEDETKARRYLSDLIRKWPNSQDAKFAKGDLFELDNLRIGKPFPEFTTTDENGQSWKLSDYRGKVVILDFWGFW